MSRKLVPDRVSSRTTGVRRSRVSVRFDINQRLAKRRFVLISIVIGTCQSGRLAADWRTILKLLTDFKVAGVEPTAR